jgi:hypothetical protein
VLAESLLLCLVVAADPSPPASLRTELDRCAARIETLKARGEETAELERLLRRAQELGAALERSATREDAGGDAAPGPEELHERADAARDEADRLTAEIAAIDVRLQDARRPETSETVQRASVGAAPAVADAKLRELHAARAALVERRGRALAEAARLEGEARQAESER